MKKLLITLFCCVTACAQFPGNVPNVNYYGGFTTGVKATLATPVGLTDTVIYVKNGTCFSQGINTGCTTAFTSNMLVTFDNETVQVCQVNAGAGQTTALTVGHSSCPNIDGRGFGGTTAATHFTTGSSLFVSYSYNKIITEIQAVETVLAPISTASGAGSVGFSQSSTYSAGTVGKSLQRIVAITDAPYNADPTGIVAADTAYSAAIASNNAVYFPPGFFTFSSDINVCPRNGLHIYGAGGGYQSQGVTFLTFTGATDGLRCTPNVGAPSGIEIDHFIIRTSNASATTKNAINFAPAVEGNNLSIHDVFMTSINTGAWNGLNITNMIANTVMRVDSGTGYGKQFSINGISNSTSLNDLSTGGTFTIGVEVLGSLSVRLIGGTIEGDPTTALFTQDGDSVVSGTYFEAASSPPVPHYIVSTSTGNGLLLDHITLGGGTSGTSAIWHSGASPVTIRDLNAVIAVNTGCVIQIDGTPAGNAQPSLITGGVIYNTVANQNAICIGTNASGLSGITVTDVGLIKALGNGTGIALKSNSITTPRITGNNFEVGGYAISNAIADGRLKFESNVRIAGLGVCTGCTLANTWPGSWAQGNGITPGKIVNLPPVGTYNMLPNLGAGILTNPGFGPAWINNSSTNTFGATCDGAGAFTVACSYNGTVYTVVGK